MKIEIIPCLSDNYSYLIYEKETNTVSIVDPSEFETCDKIANKYKKLDYMDKINVYLQFEDDIFDKVLNKYLDYVKKETQAIEIEMGNLRDIKSTIIDGNGVKINIEKIVS